MMRPHKTLQIISIAGLLITALCYSLLSVASRLLNEGVQPMTQVWLRVFVATILLILIFWKHIRWKHIMCMPRRDLFVLLVMGTIGYSVAVYFVTLGAINAKLVNVAVIFASVPFFSYLYAFLFLHKRFDVKLILLLVCSVFGIALVATKSFVPHFESFGRGEWFTLLATATMATFYVGRKMLSSYLNTSEITVTVMTIAAISGFIFAILKGESLLLSSFTNTTVLLGLAIGVGMNVITNPIEIYAFHHLDAVIGSQILLLENVFSLILGYTIYHELIGFPEIVGGLIIIISVYIANRLQID